MSTQQWWDIHSELYCCIEETAAKILSLYIDTVIFI